MITNFGSQNRTLVREQVIVHHACNHRQREYRFTYSDRTSETVKTPWLHNDEYEKRYERRAK